MSLDFNWLVGWMYQYELLQVLLFSLSWCLHSERFQLISGNSSIYSLTVRRLIKRWGTAEVMEALRREASGALAQRRRPGTMEERDESTNVAAAAGFHPRPQQEVRGAVITCCPLRNKQGAAVSCRSAVWHLSLCLRGNLSALSAAPPSHRERGGEMFQYKPNLSRGGGVNCNDFGDRLTSHLAPPSGPNCNLWVNTCKANDFHQPHLYFVLIGKC